MPRRLRAWLTLFIPAAIALSTLACGGGGDKLPFGLKSEVAVDGVHAVKAMAFTPDGRLLFGEQYSGVIRILRPDRTLQEQPFAQLTVANYLDLDWGLTSIAVHPDFEQNHYV